MKAFVWTSVCQAAFEWVKTFLCWSPVLVATLPFKLEVDASGCGTTAVLLQEDLAGIGHPVFSKMFNTHQLSYSTIEKEARAMILALQHSEVYVSSSSRSLSGVSVKCGAKCKSKITVACSHKCAQLQISLSNSFIHSHCFHKTFKFWFIQVYSGFSVEQLRSADL